MAKKQLTLDYSSSLFVEMLAFLQEQMKDHSPLCRRYGGYIYFFPTENMALLFDANIETNEEFAKGLAKFSFKEGGAKILSVNITNGYSKVVMAGSKGNTIDLIHDTKENGISQSESVVVNYTFECRGAILTLLKTYNALETISENIDKYLRLGLNNITITVRGLESKVLTTASVIYTVTQLKVNTTFLIAKEYSLGGALDDFTVKVEGDADDNGDIVVEFYIDGKHIPYADLSFPFNKKNDEKPHSIETYDVIKEGGLHTLQCRAKAKIDGEIKYSNVLYYEFVISTYGRFIVISRTLPDSNIIEDRKNLVLQSEQYIVEKIKYAYISSISNENVIVNWQLRPIEGSSENTNLGSSDLSDETSSSNGVEHELGFMPLISGRYNLVSSIKTANDTTTYVHEMNIIPNTSGLSETTDKTTMICRLLAYGRSNTEQPDERSKWEYKQGNGITVSTDFNGFDWTSLKGWYNNALVVSGGAKAIIYATPFSKMQSASQGCTFEVEFETFNVKDENAILLKIGDRISITANSASIVSAINKTTLTDKFPANTRLKLAFVVHAKSSNTNPYLMEIINNGVTSRIVNYSSSDSFVDTGTIQIGGTDLAGIKIYSIRAYTMALNTQQELNNYIVDSDDISTLVEENSIYDSDGNVDTDKLVDKIPCLSIIGKGGSNTLQTIWDNLNKVLIYCDAEWTNPKYPSTNWTCENMRVRSHGQSTLRNPLKSIKFWLKDDDTNTQYTTVFKPNGVEDTSEDHRWSMKPGSMPLNKYVMQCYYIDSSNVKSPSLMSVIDSTMKGANILTPPLKYIRDHYTNNTGLLFPYPLRLAPDSLAAIVRSKDTPTSEWHFDGIFVMMDDKKSEHLYGERSIYSAPNDPFCFFSKKSNFEVLWDNSGVTRFELLSNNHPICDCKIPSRYTVSSFYGPPLGWVDEDAEEDESVGGEDIQTFAEGGDGDLTDAPSVNPTNYDMELAAEIIYPDYDDFYRKDGSFNEDKYKVHTEKLRSFLGWAAECYAIDKGQEKAKQKFYEEALLHMDIDMWVAYYIVAMTNGCFDNMVRNMQLTTFGNDADGNSAAETGKPYVWMPLWWDIDIQDGTINTGPLVYEPPVDRTTINPAYGTAFRGSSNWIWDALEQWPLFKQRCTKIMNSLYENGYKLEDLFTLQDEYLDKWSEALYNESQNFKYRKRFLDNPTNNRRYLSYCLGIGKTYRKWWKKKNWDYWMARFAAGSFTAKGVILRTRSAVGNERASFKVSYGENTFFGWMRGDAMQPNTNGANSIEVEADLVITITGIKPDNSFVNTIYSALYMNMLDVSEFAPFTDQIVLNACVDPITGTMLERLYIGYSDELVEAGARNGQSNGYEGLSKLSQLKTLQVQGMTGDEILPLDECTSIENIYAKGSAFKSISFASSLSIKNAELPDTIKTMLLEATSFLNLTFYDTDTLATSTFPHSLEQVVIKSSGTDANIKRMVLDWIQYLDEQIKNGKEGFTWKNRSLTMNNMGWLCTYDELLLLGRMPMEYRVLSGTITCTEKLTPEQMDTLVALYNDEEKNINVFSNNSAFKIDCIGGFVLSCPSEILAGTKANIIYALFPLSSSDTMKAFSLESVMCNGVYQDVSAMPPNSDGIIINQNFRLNTWTGEITTTEDGTEDTTYVIRANTYPIPDKDLSGTVTTVVKKRTYPNTITIEGERNIAYQSDYLYEARFEPSDYTGTQNSAMWILDQYDTNKVSVEWVDNEKTNTTARLIVNKILADERVGINYISTWKDGKVRQTSWYIDIVYGATQPVLEFIVNPAVYLLFAAYAKDLNIKLEEEGVVRRIEAQLFKDTPPSIVGAENVKSFNEIKDFKNLTNIDLHNTGLNRSINDGILDLTKLLDIKSVNISGTLASVMLIEESGIERLSLGTPYIIYQVNCDNLSINNFNIQDNKDLRSIDIIKGQAPFAMLLKVMNASSNE